MFFSERPLVGTLLVTGIDQLRPKCRHGYTRLRSEPGRVVVPRGDKHLVAVVEDITRADGSLKTQIALHHFKPNACETERSIIAINNGDRPFLRSVKKLLWRIHYQSLLVDGISLLHTMDAQQVAIAGDWRRQPLSRLVFFRWHLGHFNAHIPAEVDGLRRRHKDNAIHRHVRGNRDLRYRVAPLLHKMNRVADCKVFRFARRRGRCGNALNVIGLDRSGDFKVKYAEIRSGQMENGAAAKFLSCEIENGI